MRKLYLSFAVAAAIALAWWSAGRPGTESVTYTEAPPAGAPTPRAALELPQRVISAQSRDPFALPPRPKPAPVVVSAPAVVAPTAPPLPYKYDGSGELQGQRFVFLARGGKSFRISAGDTLEGTYVVETVSRDRVVLRYLPLDFRQVLMYSGGEPPAEIAATPLVAQPVALQVDVPGEVMVGHEFVVMLALPGAAALKATVEVGYDPEVLSMLGSHPRRPGRAVVELPSGNSARAHLRFKVLADSPSSTDIDMHASARDASGKRVPISTPPAYTVSLVLPGG